MSHRRISPRTIKSDPRTPPSRRDEGTQGSCCQRYQDSDAASHLKYGIQNRLIVSVTTWPLAVATEVFSKVFPCFPFLKIIVRYTVLYPVSFLTTYTPWSCPLVSLVWPASEPVGSSYDDLWRPVVEWIVWRQVFILLTSWSIERSSKLIILKFYLEYVMLSPSIKLMRKIHRFKYNVKASTWKIRNM